MSARFLLGGACLCEASVDTPTAIPQAVVIQPSLPLADEFDFCGIKVVINTNG